MDELDTDDKICAYINQTPILMSLLYDLNLLPEQNPNRDSEAWEQIFIITNHWREHDIRHSQSLAGDDDLLALCGDVLQAVTDPENQPHQWVGQRKELENYLGQLLRERIRRG